MGNNAPGLVAPTLGSGGALTLAFAPDQNGSATLTVRATDAGGLFAETTLNVTVTPVNDAPSVALGGNVAVLTGSGAFARSGYASQITAGPVDETGQIVSFQLSSDNAALFSVAPAIDSAGQLTFTPAASASGAATITVTAQDSGGTANGGVDTSAPQYFTVTLSGPPTNSVPGAQTNVSNQPLYFTAANTPDNSIRVADPESAFLTVTLSVTNGTVTVALSTTVDATGNGTTNLVLYGPLADLNATLQTLTYQSFTNAFGADLLTVVTVDDTLPAGLTNIVPTAVPIRVEVPSLGGLPTVSLDSLNTPTRTLTNVVAVTTGPNALDTRLVQGVMFNAVSNVINVLPVSGQNGETQRTTITVTAQFSDGTTQLIQVPVVIYQPLLAPTTDNPVYDTTFAVPTFNLQTSLYEQKVRVQNTTPFNFTALRITATNLPATVTLQNATLTNGGLAYIDYNQTVPAGASVTLKLEYFSGGLQPFTPLLKLELLNTTRTIAAPPGAVVTAVAAKTGYSVDGLVKNYLYFPSAVGQRYYVQYFDTVTVPQVWKTSGVVIQGTGLEIHWMDDGPPSTETPLGPLRFYRVVTDR
ncbi:MAG: hypothetical protein RL514_2558 [Verrucomicrobiota bacterium]|jgi:hypothetical protein